MFAMDGFLCVCNRWISGCLEWMDFWVLRMDGFLGVWNGWISVC